MAILREAAMATPPGEEPPQLLPPTGIRWSDNAMAMDKVAEAHDMAVLRMDVMDEDHEMYTLISLEGSVATVDVRRLQDAPWTWATARVGPFPDESESLAEAASLQSSFMEWIASYGRMKRVPPLD